jgi:hypothetical protein
MLGLYEQFPQNIHKTVIFTTSLSTKKLQQTLIQALHKVNSESFALNEVATPSSPQYTVVFEFGIAESNNFNYLDDGETKKAYEVMEKKPFQILDFFCVLRYYKMQNEERKSLRFDYYMTRFAFNKNMMKIQIFHERGPRYVTPEELAFFVVDKISELFSRKVLNLLEHC